MVGDDVKLDGPVWFPGTARGESWTWRQVFGSQDSLEYLTVHFAALESGPGGMTIFRPAVPGNYGFEAHDPDGGLHRVDVHVGAIAPFTLEAKGAVFGDVFGQLGGPLFDLSPDDSRCRDLILDEAMAGPVRAGMGWVAVVPAAFYSQVRPWPEFVTWPGLSLEDDGFYAALVQAARRAGLKVVHVEQEAPGVEFSQEELAELEAAKRDPVWWAAWFDAWQAWIVPRAARAEANGVDVFVPFLLADFTFLPDVYPQYASRWRELLAAIREVYHGTIAMSFDAVDERLTFADAFDLAFVSFDSGQYTWDPEAMADPEHPTLSEVAATTERLLDRAQRLDMLGLPVYLIVQFKSSDGQGGTESTEIRPKPAVDFQEQALYYESFFATLEDEPWVRGVFSERWDWFDQFDRGDASPEATYFDQTIEGSPRSKPAEEVLRLWFEIY